MALVTSALTLSPAAAHTARELSRDVQRQIKEEAMDHLAATDAILPHIMDIKVVRNQRKNFINLR